MIYLKKILLEQQLPIEPDDEEKDSVPKLSPHLMKQALKNKKIQAKRNRKAARKLKRLKLVSTIDLPDGEYKGAYQYESIGGVNPISKKMPSSNKFLYILDENNDWTGYVYYSKLLPTIRGRKGPTLSISNGQVVDDGFRNRSQAASKLYIAK